MQRDIVIIAHNIRSAHNVGSIFRTADGFGINKIYITGYSPYPQQANDIRLPHETIKTHNKISKTSLGAEESVRWEHRDNVKKVIKELKKSGYKVCALEQSKGSIYIDQFSPPDMIALLLGNELDGVSRNLLKECDAVLEIPMSGKKESFNVAIASAIAIFSLRFNNQI